MAFEYDIFFSYSHLDQELANAITSNLESEGFRVFISSKALRNHQGKSYVRALSEALENSRSFIVLASANALKSEFVQSELEVFFDQCHIRDRSNRRLFLLMGEGFDSGLLPALIRPIQHSQTVEEIIGNLRQLAPDIPAKKDIAVEDVVNASGILKEGLAWEQALEESSIEGYEKFLDEFPNDVNSMEATYRLYSLKKEKENYENEERAWKKSKSHHSPDSYKKFLNDFPEGRHAVEAHQLLEETTRLELEQKQENDAWSQAKEEGSADSFQAFLKVFPNGNHAEEAQDEIKRLERLERVREKRAWTRAVEENTYPAYARYLEKFPRGPNAAEAKKQVKSLLEDEEENKERREWLKACQENTIAAYQKYLSTYTSGRFVKEAKALIAKLKTTAPVSKPATVIKEKQPEVKTGGDSWWQSILGVAFLIGIIIFFARTCGGDNDSSDEAMLNDVTIDYNYYWDKAKATLNDSLAILYYDSAINLSPQIAALYVGRGVRRNGLVPYGPLSYLLHRDKYQVALDDFEKAIYLDPKNATAYANKANTLINMRDHDEALNISEQAFLMDSADAYIMAVYGKALCRKGFTEKGCNYLMEAMNKNSEYAKANYQNICGQ